MLTGPGGVGNGHRRWACGKWVAGACVLGPTVSEYLLAWGRRPGCGMFGWIGSSGRKVVAERPTMRMSVVGVNGRLSRKAYGGGTSLGMRRRDVLTWGGKMKRQLVEVEDGSGARRSQLVGARVVPVQLEMSKLGVLGKHLAMEES